MRHLLIREYTRRLRRSPVRLFLIITYCVLAAWSVLDGLAWKESITRNQRERPPEHHVDRKTWTKELQDLQSEKETSPQKARPMNLSLPAILPPGPLSQLSHHGETIHPNSTILNGWKNDTSLFRRYEIEGPVPLSIMGIDLSYVMIVLFPLVLLLSTFDALSAEIDSGRLRLLMVQGLSVRSLVVARIVAVASLLWSATLVAALLACALDASSDAAHGQRWGHLAVWMACASAYALFWIGVSLWVSTRFRRSMNVALAAIGLWVGVVLLVPSIVQFTAQALYPTPSRVEYLSEARTAQATARRDIEKRAEVYMAEHEVEIGEGTEKVPGYFRSYFIANAHINAQTAPLVQAREQQRLFQATLANRMEFLAPSMLASRVLAQAAGTGNERASDYRAQVREHLAKLHQAIGPATVAKRRLTLDQANAIPDFHFRESELNWMPWLSITWLLLLFAVLAGLGNRQVNAIQPIHDHGA